MGDPESGDLVAQRYKAPEVAVNNGQVRGAARHGIRAGTRKKKKKGPHGLVALTRLHRLGKREEKAKGLQDASRKVKTVDDNQKPKPGDNDAGKTGSIRGPRDGGMQI